MTNPNRSAAVTEVVRDIEVEEVLPHSPEKIWRALTTAELLARWLMRTATGRRSRRCWRIPT